MPLAKFLSQKAALTKTKPLNLSYHYAILGSPTAGSPPTTCRSCDAIPQAPTKRPSAAERPCEPSCPDPSRRPRESASHESLGSLLEEAATALGRLDAVTELLPDPHVFVYGYVRKEAVLSSQIEGLQSSLANLMLHEAGGVPGPHTTDVLETSNAVAALNHGVERLRGGFPISNRLMREMHARLFANGRGKAMTPGEFRRSQNWIGGSRPGNAAFVPPPPNHVQECMADLELFIHATDDELPVLVRAGLAHVQFETIHPFLDGNGRLGRLLITLMLCDAGLLREPLLTSACTSNAIGAPTTSFWATSGTPVIGKPG